MVNFVQNVTSGKEKLFLKPPKLKKRGKRNPYEKKRQMGSNHMVNEMQKQNNDDKCSHEKLYFASENKSDSEWINGKYGKKMHRTRFWVQNPNGVSAKNDFRIFRGDVEEAKDNFIDFLALPEMKLNANNKFVHERLTTLVANHSQHSKLCITNTTGYNLEECTQPGGVGCIAMGRLAGRFAGMGCDKLGRYTWMKFKGATRTIKVYSVYRVSQSSHVNLGETTAYVQQYQLLNKKALQECEICENDEEAVRKEKEKKKRTMKLINPKRAVMDALLLSIKADIQEKTLIIVLGDFNEDVYLDALNDKFNEVGMSNVVKEFIPDKEGVRSYNRGAKVIDGMWVSCSLLPHVEKVGMAPFRTVLNSDHRGLFMDVDLKHILDAPNMEFKTMQFRRLQCSMPKRKETYCNKVNFYWKYHRIHEKLAAIKSELKLDNVDQENIERRLNTLDSQISEIMRSAEKSCTNVGKHAIHEWSIELSKAITEEREIKKRISELKRCQVHTNISERKILLKKEVEQYKKVKADLKLIKKNAKKYRDEHLDALITENLEKNPASHYAMELKRLKHIEEQRRDAKLIRLSAFEKKKVGISKVLIPAPSEYEDENEKNAYRDMDVIWKRLQKHNGKDIKRWEEVEEQGRVEYLTMACMQSHFAQAHGSRLTKDVWKDRLISDEFINNLKRGDIEELRDESEAVQEYFRAIADKAAVRDLQKFHYTLEQWKRHIMQVKERTATSPSGRHYGHFKVLLEKEPKIFEDIYEVMNVAYKFGIMLERWKKTVTVLIPKDKGIPQIHRLRPLHIVEPEVNALAKALWAKKLMAVAESTGNMTNDQFGGRKNRQAQSAVLNKLLYYDINRQSMVEAQYDDIDMKSNYDRELVRLVSAEARVKLGLHRDDARFMVNFVEAQQFHVKTKYGVSDKYYTYGENENLYGLGQGIAWSGPGWLMSSSTLAECKKKSCVGMVYTSPIDKELEVKKDQDMFVDDMGCGCNKVDEKNEQRKRIMQQAQHNLQKHSDYVEVTGGLIAADKSHCYSVKWKYEDGQKVPVIEGSERDLELKQGDGVTRKIKLKKSDVEHKTLGCWVNPIGVNEKAKQQIKMMIKTWTNRMEHSYLKPKLVRKSYETELKMQIQYRMPIYRFSKADCDDMMKLINPTILHAHYANKNYARSLLEANDQYAGMKITHLYDVMGTEKLKFLFMHLRRWDDTGKLIMISMQKTQLECGTSKFFFQLDYDKWAKFVTPTWSTHLWEYCNLRAIKLEIKKKIIYDKPRENDKFIMDVLAHSNLFSDDELLKINCVRQHLQLLTLADMVDLRGRKILQSIKHARMFRSSNFNFVKQEPLDTWLELWKKKACMVLNKYVSKYPLGAWIAPTHQGWEWKRNIGNTKVLYCGSMQYIRQGNVYKKSDRSIEMEEESQNGVELLDVNFDRRGNPYVVAFERKDMICVKAQVKEAESGMDVDAGEILNWVRTKDNLMQAIENDEWCIATDGSNYVDEGAYAWGIAGTDGQYIVKGKGRVACAREDSSSLRPEMIAIIQALRFVEKVWRKNVIVQSAREDIRRVPIYTDSEVTIKDMEHSYFPTTKNAFENNIDVKIELKALLRTSKVKYELIHVRSHQDEKKEEWELTMPEKLNCEIDKFAATVYEDVNCGIHSNMAPCLRSQICSLVLPYHRPTSNILEQIVAYANGHNAEQQLSTYWNIPMPWMCNIEWQSLRKAIRRERESKKHHLSKLIHKQLPTFAMLKRNKMSSTDVCPICGKASETWDHVIKCQHFEMKQAKVEEMDIVKKTLEKKKTHPVLQQRIVAAMLQYINDYPITIPEGDGLCREINESFRDQMTLGIGNMFCGVMTHKFGDIQQKYYNETNANARMYTKTEWNIAIIRVLLNFSRNIWKHRCEYVHNVSTISLENQERETAWNICSYVRKQPWTMRKEDLFLAKKKREYFLQSKIDHVRCWVERIQLSMDVAQMIEQTTRQDIRKWLHIPANPIGKRIQYYNQEKQPVKKFHQRKLDFCSVNNDTAKIHRSQRVHASTAAQARDAGDNAGSADGNHGEYAYVKNCDEIDRDVGREMGEFLQTIYESEGEKSNVERPSGSSVDSWDEADDVCRVEYEMHMDDEEGWNMGLRSLKSHEGEEEGEISDEYRSIVNTLEQKEHEVCMKEERYWNHRLPDEHYAGNDEDQASLEIKKMRKKSWWENINNWFVKKINSNRRQERNELQSEKEEEIIFIEDSDLPTHEGTCENTALRTKNEWSNVIRMGSLEVSTQEMNESLIYDSLGNSSGSASDMTIGTKETNMDLEGYIRLQKNEKPTRRKKMLRRLINSHSQQSMRTICEDGKVLSLYRYPLMVNSRECDDESKESRTCEKVDLRNAKRSVRVKTILNEIDSCGTLDESSEDSCQLCILEEISLEEPGTEMFPYHVEDSRSILQNEKYIENRICEQKTSRAVREVTSYPFLNEIKRSSAKKKVPNEIYIIANDRKSEYTKEMKKETSWKADNKKRQTSEKYNKNIKTVREGSNDSGKVNQAHSLQVGQVKCINNKYNGGTNMNLEQTSYHEHQEKANTFRGGSRGEATQTKQEFLNQLKEVDEACLQQRTHELVAKTRDRDLFGWIKQQKQSLGALPQEHPEKCGQAKHAKQKSNGGNLACEINNGVENEKPLTEGMILKMSFRKEDQQAGVQLRISDNMIGKSKFSEVRDSTDSNPPRSAMTSETLHDDKAGLKNLEVCEQFYSIFRKKNNVES